MTPKERIIRAFKNDIPDRVPVSPELWDVIPIRFSGRPFYELSGTSFGKVPLWKAQLDAYRYFKCEAWIPVEPGPSKRQQKIVQTHSSFTNKNLIKTVVTYETPKGTLTEIKHSCFDYDLWSRGPPVEDIGRDFPIIEEYFFDDPTQLDYSEIEKAYDETGDAGICEGIVGNTFFEFLTLFRRGGAVQVIFDLYDHTDFFERLQKKYIDYLTGIAEEICLRTRVEGIFLNCGSATLKIISPDLFKRWDIPLVEAVSAVAKKHSKIFHYHLHGMGRALLDDLVEAGITMICPLEDPPRGDFLLGEVKKKFCSRLALKGGIDPFLLRDGTEKEIELKVKGCIEEAANGGGYTLATGDGVLKETAFERIIGLVQLAEKYGRYY
jgi:uroporphyrinogen decarboxylase